jgi:glycosyltransferase involved in cell wall biosynthesis
MNYAPATDATSQSTPGPPPSGSERLATVLDDTAPGQVHVAYVLQSFPGETLTFIAREIDAIRRLGGKISIIANRRAANPEALGAMSKYNEEVRYLQPLSLAAVLASHFRALLREPRRYLDLLRLVLRYTRHRPNERLRSLKHFAGAPLIAKYVAESGATHMHAHFTANGATLAMFASRLTGIGYSVTAHNCFLTDTVLLLPKLRFAKSVAVISAYARDFLLSRYPDIENLDEKMKLVRCGIDAADFSKIDRRPALQAPVPLVLSVGQLVPRKGHDVLLKAIQRVISTGHLARLVIVGDGPDKDALVALTAELGLTDHVTFAGAIPQSEVRSLLSQASVFCLACRRAPDGDEDGIPVALMEAMAAGVPCISTRVAGIPELILHGKTGLLADDGDFNALAAAITELTRDDAVRAALIEGARQHVRSDFDIDANASRLLECFSRAAKNADISRDPSRHASRAAPIKEATHSQLELLLPKITIPRGLFVCWAKTTTSHRSAFIARQLGMSLLTLPAPAGRLLMLPFRYATNFIHTLRQLRLNQPRVIFVQNPPVVAIFAALNYARRNQALVVADSHTGALLDRKWRWSRFVLRNLASEGHLNVLTNAKLGELAALSPLDCVVLPDPPVVAAHTKRINVPVGQAAIMVVTSGGADEPIDLVLSVAQRMPNILFYCTGGLSTRSSFRTYTRRLVDNVIALEYLPDRCFYGLMQSVNGVLCLTTRDYTLLSGAQEALWLKKPMIVSDTETLRDYMGDVARIVNHSEKSIVDAIEAVCSNSSDAHQKVAASFDKKLEEYRATLDGLARLVEGRLAALPQSRKSS